MSSLKTSNQKIPVILKNPFQKNCEKHFLLICESVPANFVVKQMPVNLKRIHPDSTENQKTENQKTENKTKKIKPIPQNEELIKQEQKPNQEQDQDYKCEKHVKL
jgi:hypothetical protein